MKTVNLDEIFRSHNKIGFWQKETVDNVLSAMREACNQSIELAADGNDNIFDNNGKIYCSKQSILNTKSQII